MASAESARQCRPLGSGKGRINGQYSIVVTRHVWSKEIVSRITAGVGVILVVRIHYWGGLKEAGIPIYRVANAPVVVPVWLAAALELLLMGLARSDTLSIDRAR